MVQPYPEAVGDRCASTLAELAADPALSVEAHPEPGAAWYSDRTAFIVVWRTSARLAAEAVSA